MRHPPKFGPRLVFALAVAPACLVLAVLAVLGVLGGNAQARLLHDGYPPPSPYRWVKPPAELAPANLSPASTVVDLRLGADGTDVQEIATDDGQFVLNLPRGAIGPRRGEGDVRVDVMPLDPARLDAVPSGLQADGNAYRVSMAYRPSGQPAGPLVEPGHLVLTVPETTSMMLYSPDGRSWKRVTARNENGPVAPDSSFDRPGYYLGVTERTEASSGIGDRVAAAAVITVVVAGGLWFVPALKRRRQRRRPTPPRH